MKKFSMILVSLFVFSLALSSCAVPGKPSLETQSSPAGTSVKAETFLEDTATQTEPETEASVEAEILCSNEKYTITNHPNGCRINFVDGNNSEEAADGAISGEIKFSTVAEMRSAFLNNTLTEQQINTIRQTFADDTTGIYLCNLNALYEPVLPDHVSPKYISLTGTNYSFYVGATEQYASADIYVASSNQYNSLYSYAHEPHSAEYTSVTEQAEDQFGNTPCEIIEYVYTGSGATFRDYLLSFSQDHVQTEIVISYRLIGPTPSLIEYRESETLPANIWIFQEVNDLRFVYHIRDLEIEPTVEWLTSFGVTPYVDNSDHVAS